MASSHPLQLRLGSSVARQRVTLQIKLPVLSKSNRRDGFYPSRSTVMDDEAVTRTCRYTLMIRGSGCTPLSIPIETVNVRNRSGRLHIGATQDLFDRNFDPGFCMS